MGQALGTLGDNGSSIWPLNTALYLARSARTALTLALIVGPPILYPYVLVGLMN